MATIIVFEILGRSEFIGFILVYPLVLLPVALAWAFGLRALGARGAAHPAAP